MSNEPSGSLPAGTLPFLAIAAVGLLAVHLTLYLTGSSLADPPQLHDSDAYMWLSRVRDLAASGAWFDHLNIRISPPDGLVQHWTRPMDLLLLAGAAVLSPVLGFERGLLYWGIVLPPLLHAATLVVLVLDSRKLVDAGLLKPAQLPLVGILFLAQIGVYAPFWAGRPDHHAPLAFLFVLNLCLWLRLVSPNTSESDRRRTAIALGVVGAVAVWINVASLVFVALGMAALCVEWIWWRQGQAGRNAVYSLTLLGACAIALLVEWGPYGMSIRQPDTLSVSHLALFGLAFAFWKALELAEKTRWGAEPGSRFLTVAASGAVSLGILALGFPELIGHPFGEVDPLFEETFLEHTSELQPIHRIASGIGPSIGVVLLLLGPGLAAAIYLANRLLRSVEPGHRSIAVFLLLMLLGYSVMAAGQARWTDHVGMAAVLPLSLAAADCIRWAEQRLDSQMLPRARMAIMSAFLVLPPAMGAAASVVGPSVSAGSQAYQTVWRSSGFATPPEVEVLSSGRRTDSRCDIATVSSLLMDGGYFPSPIVVMAHANYGPELLYRTHHSVLSITNHRPQSGYGLTREILGSTNHTQAEKLLKANEIGAIVLCARDVRLGFFRFPDQEKTFVERLSRGEPPAGFVLHAATEDFKIFRSTGAR